MIFEIFIVFLLLKVFSQLLLEKFNLNSIVKNRADQQVQEIMDEATLNKTINYSVAKGRFSMFKIVYSSLVLLLVVSTGVIPFFYDQVSGVFESKILINAFFIVVFMTLLSFVSLPLSLFNTFVLEAKFGFNKMTFKLFMGDLLKSVVISFVFSFPLALLLFSGIELFPNSWWLVGSFIVIGFQLVMQFIFPKFILPLFNKLTPLPDGELKDEVIHLANELKFNTKEILVMDGSRRSKHSNAFFTGFGKSRRVVFFDTLVEQLKINELKAVFAHEVGHYKKKHILKGFLVGILMTFVGFKLLHWATIFPSFNLAFDLIPGEIAQTFLVFLLISNVIGFFVSPLSNLFSRKNEYEADAYAKQALGEGESLVSALRRLYLENLANLKPHALYSFFYYSHPTFFERRGKLLNN